MSGDKASVKHVIRTGSGRLMLELSDEPGPDYLATRGIQKGLIAYHDGACLVQEGLGFGAPILGTRTETYFSKNGRIDETEDGIAKTFQFDCVSKIELGSKRLENPALRYGFEGLVGLYMRMESIQPALLKLQRAFARSFNASCSFIDVEPAGSARVVYRPARSGVRIAAEFRTALKGPQFTMVNEQGADFFDRAELDGRKLTGHGISGWMSARNARLWSFGTGVSFEILNHTPAQLFAGRERTPYLSWAGLDIHSKSRRISYELAVGEVPGGPPRGPAGASTG